MDESLMGSFVADGAAIQRLLNGPQGAGLRACSVFATSVQRRARVRVGKRTRNLERSIVKRFYDFGNGKVGVLVGSELPYALLHHEGTKPHEIRPVRAKALRFVVDGQVVFAARVSHPGTKPNRYLTDSLQDVQQGIIA